MAKALQLQVTCPLGHEVDAARQLLAATPVHLRPILEGLAMALVAEIEAQRGQLVVIGDRATVEAALRR